jgi:hypothetical protein
MHRSATSGSHQPTADGGGRFTGRRRISSRHLSDYHREIGGVLMKIRTTRSAGMLLLALWLILTGIGGFVSLPIPGVFMASLALLAGILILVGM